LDRRDCGTGRESPRSRVSPFDPAAEVVRVDPQQPATDLVRTKPAALNLSIDRCPRDGGALGLLWCWFLARCSRPRRGQYELYLSRMFFEKPWPHQSTGRALVAVSKSTAVLRPRVCSGPGLARADREGFPTLEPPCGQPLLYPEGFDGGGRVDRPHPISRSSRYEAGTPGPWPPPPSAKVHSGPAGCWPRDREGTRSPPVATCARAYAPRDPRAGARGSREWLG
jgi:hypothetical protein